jgi:hypothetical protein
MPTSPFPIPPDSAGLAHLERETPVLELQTPAVHRSTAAVPLSDLDTAAAEARHGRNPLFQWSREPEPSSSAFLSQAPSPPPPSQQPQQQLVVRHTPQQLLQLQPLPSGPLQWQQQQQQQLFGNHMWQQPVDPQQQLLYPLYPSHGHHSQPALFSALLGDDAQAKTAQAMVAQMQLQRQHEHDDQRAERKLQQQQQQHLLLLSSLQWMNSPRTMATQGGPLQPLQQMTYVRPLPY